MIARIVTLLAVFYLMLVAVGVALVSSLQASIGFLPALGAALGLFLVAVWGLSLLVRRRLTRYRAFLGAYQDQAAAMMRRGGR